MPLLDHFHPPLHPARRWPGFHNAWATSLSADLNRRLPTGYFAEMNVEFGIEIDVAAFQDTTGSGRDEEHVPPSWEPPTPVLTLPLTVITDDVEIKVYNETAGPILAGAIELISPSNKDRPASRDAFVTKCASYLQQGIGLVVIDIVTERSGNLHDALLARVAPTSPAWGVPLYAASYHPIKQAEQPDGQANLQVWPSELQLGQPLPTALPFCLRGGFCLPLDLEATYTRTCQEQRIPRPGA